MDVGRAVDSHPFFSQKSQQVVPSEALTQSTNLNEYGI